MLSLHDISRMFYVKVILTFQSFSLHEKLMIRHNKSINAFIFFLNGNNISSVENNFI